MAAAAPLVVGSSLSLQLERQRARTWLGIRIAAAFPVLGWPLAFLIGDGSETRDSIGGFLLIAGIIGLVTTWVFLRDWQRGFAGKLLDVVAAEQPGLVHIDGQRQAAARAALTSGDIDITAFQGVGLMEPFATAQVEHVLSGPIGRVPFLLTEVRLVNQEGYQVFRGALASFATGRGGEAITVVGRDWGLIGNAVARFGSTIERVTLEDPTFEAIFEAYGTDQVEARVVLTTTMLERLRALDTLARGLSFRCAFAGGRILLAFPGMRWRPSWWLVARPLAGWVTDYRQWLETLIRLPARIIEVLALGPASRSGMASPAGPARLLAAAPAPVNVTAAADEPFTGGLSRIVAGVGMALIYIASGTLFGGLAAFFGWMILREEGWSAIVGNAFMPMIALGLLYGIGAVGFGAMRLFTFVRTWRGPLRGLPASGWPGARRRT
ncbi:membrane hypothetical protein [Candidatus Defluviicoccus seviourii]|uniref:Uncharacterized protein n=1 Tax=Candidatus Defluviicoccus seviourii TaxID=2565273 RepID=A0A564WBR7_9PROT|nr:membrane hypothetical protein [Candidatus Defluviicoccus seviourii]